MKQRIIFVDLHGNWMLMKTAMVYIFKFSAAVKHWYLLKFLLEHQNEYEICNLITEQGLSIYSKRTESFGKLFCKLGKIENRLTLKINKIPYRQIKVLNSPDEIQRSDIVIVYSICSNISCLRDKDTFKALSMLHFHGSKGEDKAIRDAGINCLFNETNLQKTSEIFRRFYDLPLPWIIHPFVYAERFKCITPFSQRKNKCFSTGTITYKEHPEFLEVYNDPCDQPARKFVKDNPDFFKDTVDCYSSDYLEDNPGKKVIPTDNSLIKIYKKIYNRMHVGKQKKYFSFNMVEKFNEYKMHLLGEEILGVPGIGFVEGMACGSAYIGLDSPMYRDYGLIPGVHYIAYDGTKEGLKETVEYWQRAENQDELEQIAKRGCKYVRENFNGNKVAEKLLTDLRALRDEWLKTKS